MHLFLFSVRFSNQFFRLFVCLNLVLNILFIINDKIVFIINNKIIKLVSIDILKFKFQSVSKQNQTK